MCKTVAFVGAKGGTLKSSTLAALGHLYATAGLDVAMVDADPQGTLTRRHGLARSPDPLSTDPLALDYDPMLRTAGRVALLPGGRALEATDEYRIAEHLARARTLGAGLVLVDTPPALGPIVRATMRAADLIVISCPPGMEALDGYGDMFAAARAVAPATPVRALVVLAHARSRILRWTLEEFARAFPGALYDIIIPIEMAAAEAGTFRRPVTLSAPRSRSAAAYRALARVIARDLDLDVDLGEEA